MINEPHGQQRSSQKEFPLNVHIESGHDSGKSAERKTFEKVEVVVEGRDMSGW